MYVPTHFRDDDPERLVAFARANAFALLVSAAPGGVQATHLPLLLDVEGDGGWRLTGHFARANPHWRALEAGVESLVVFSGVHGYISPRWYVSANMVPTWNYVAVHARGEATAFEERDRLHDVLVRLSAEHEAGSERPWSPDQMDAARYDTMLGHIVGFEMRVATVTGKRKLGQNRLPADRESAAAALRARGDEASLALAALMAEA